jgi:DNA modification methylase
MRQSYPLQSQTMQTIPISSIIVDPERQRSSFDDTAQGELNESIQTHGLISPIIIRIEADGPHLVAGERRLRGVSLLATLGIAIKHAGEPVPRGSIPIIDFGSLSTLQQQELEYAENAHRQDLTWQENLRATERLHTLRTAQAAGRGEVQTINATAEEIFGRSDGSFRDTVRTALVVAKHMDNPAVAKAPTLREAAKVIRRVEETGRREHLAAVQGTRSISERYKAYQTDCLSWMKDQPDAQFDVILTDPPYGMGADTFGDAAGRMAGIDHEYADGAEETHALLRACIPEWFRLAKAQAHLYIWCDIDMFAELRTMCRDAGWWTFRTPLINLKPEGGRVPWPENGPRRSYELCLFAVKGKRPVTSIRPDYFESRLTEGNFGHGAQKPVEAYVELLKRSCRPGDTVLDSFAGTGTIFPAAAAVGVNAVGTEMAQAAYGICLERIASLS